MVKCLALDAITASRALAPDPVARDSPATLIREPPTEDEREVIEEVVRQGRLVPSTERRKPPPRGQARLGGAAEWLLTLEATTHARERSALAGLREDTNDQMA